MEFSLLHRRDDGTFVIGIRDPRPGQADVVPYHVIPSDPIWDEVSAAAEGVDLPPEPPPPVFEAPLVLPTPLEWMDRLPADRQAVLLDALDLTPEGRRFQKRMLAAREIDPSHADVQAGVAMMLAAEVLTEDEAAALLVMEWPA